MMRPGLSCVLLWAVAACAPVLAAPQPDPALFAPKASWSYAIPANPPAGIPTPTRAQRIEDVAFLQHGIEEAWAWSSRSTIDSFRSLPSRLHRVAVEANDSKSLCDGIATVLRNTGIVIELGGVCGRVVSHTPVGGLDTVPPNRNYKWRLDRAKDHVVGILTVSNLVDPQHAGWAGLDRAIKELATTDLLIVDLQHARGDDPRAGFALLAALGLENYSRSYFRAPTFRDGPIAKTSRANVPAAVPARSRTLWSTFSTEADVIRIARQVVPGIARPARFIAMRMLVGPDCGRACQLLVQLVRFQGIDLFGSFDDASGDEWGAIRLPHSGIVARFPTVAYGPYIIGPLESGALPPDYAKTLLAGMHQIGRARAASLAWRTRSLPSCAKNKPRRSLVQQKVTGCLPNPLPAGMAVQMSFSVEAATAVRFLRTCPGLTVGGAMDMGPIGDSSVSVSGSPEAISLALQAPFDARASWGCESHID